MSFFTEIAIFFQGMGWIVPLLLLLGYIFLVIELFQPGFGIFGIVGVALIVLGTVLRIYKGDGNIFAQIFIIIFMESVAVLIAFLALALTAKNGWVKRSPLIESGTAVGINRSEGTIDFSELEGKFGTAITDLKPIGRANVEGVVVDVVSGGFYIEKGENLKVTRIEGSKITVEKID